MTYAKVTDFFLHQRRTVGMFLVLWTVFALFEIGSDWYRFNSAGWSFAMARHVAQSILIFFPWFLISLAIGALVWSRPRQLDTLRGYLIHGGVAVVIGLTHLLVVVLSTRVTFPRMLEQTSYSDVFLKQFLNWFHFELLVYFAVLFIWQMILQKDRSVQSVDERQRIVGRIGENVHIATPESVDWIEGANNYVIAHVGNQEIRVRETLKSLQDRLGPDRFVRVHRSALVNIDRLRRIDGTGLVMANGARVTCSRSGKKTLKQCLGRGEIGT